jgi:hypothetical protein
MAAPPDLGLALVEGLRPPVVIWNAIGIDRLDDAADQAVGVEHTTTVGCQFLVGAMARIGLAPAAVVTTAPHDPASRSRLRRSVRAAGAAGAVRGAALVRIGAPPPGYLNVAVDDADLAALGLRVVDVDGGDLEAMVGSGDGRRRGADTGAARGARRPTARRRADRSEPAPGPAHWGWRSTCTGGRAGC